MLGFEAERDDIAVVVDLSLRALFEKDAILITNDVSERAIAHKLAEHLQGHFSLSVDCEYNRNLEQGPGAQKLLHVLKESRVAQLGPDLDEEQMLAISTYPDIIVHRRGINCENLLIIELKKKANSSHDAHDYLKLGGFTQVGGDNPYHYKFGLFIKLATGAKNAGKADLVWFKNGAEIRPER